MDLISDKELIDSKTNPTRKVYKARFSPTNEWICMKEQYFSTLPEANAPVREALHQQSIQHPSVCPIKKFFLAQSDEDWKAVILMEWMPSTLLKELKKRKREKRPWTDDELITLLRSLVGALTVAQEKNISHRDLSLSNLLVGENGDVKIGDFGCSKWENEQIEAQTYIGTLAYFSPELRKASSNAMNRARPEKVNHNLYKSDVYALGVCFLYMATLTENPQMLDNSDSFIWEAFLNSAGSLQGYDTLKPVLQSMLAVSESDRPDFRELSQRLAVERPPPTVEQVLNPYDLLSQPSISINRNAEGTNATPYPEDIDLAHVEYSCEECKQQMRFEGGQYLCPDATCLRNRVAITEVPSQAVSAMLGVKSVEDFYRNSCVKCSGICSLVSSFYGKKAIILPCKDLYCSLPCLLTYVSDRTCNFQLRNSLACQRCSRPFYYKFIYDCVGGARAYFQLSLNLARRCVVCVSSNSQYRLGCGQHFVCFEHLGVMLEAECRCPKCPQDSC